MWRPLGVIVPADPQAASPLKDPTMATSVLPGSHDPEFEQQMDAARKIMKSRRDVLHELAK